RREAPGILEENPRADRVVELFERRAPELDQELDAPLDPGLVGEATRLEPREQERADALVVGPEPEARLELHQPLGPLDEARRVQRLEDRLLERRQRVELEPERLEEPRHPMQDARARLAARRLPGRLVELVHEPLAPRRIGRRALEQT